MKIKVLAVSALVAAALVMNQGTSLAGPAWSDTGPTIGGSATRLGAGLKRPISLAAPLQITIGAGAGSVTESCTVAHEEIRVTVQLWLLPLFGDGSLVNAGSGHGVCGTDACDYAEAFAAVTALPGIYQLQGTVQTKDGGVFADPESFYGRSFLYDPLGLVGGGFSDNPAASVPPLPPPPPLPTLP